MELDLSKVAHGCFESDRLEKPHSVQIGQGKIVTAWRGYYEDIADREVIVINAFPMEIDGKNGEVLENASLNVPLTFPDISKKLSERLMRKKCADKNTSLQKPGCILINPCDWLGS